MKKILTIIFLILIHTIAFSQGFKNNGAEIKIDDGYYVTITGADWNFTNQSGSIDLKGNLIVEGNWTNNATFTASNNGTVVFSGSSSQSISGSSTTTFNHLTIDNANGISIAKSPVVNGVLTFNSGKITTGANKITLGVSATTTGAATGKYIYGNEVMTIPTGAFPSRTFAIGDADNFTPVKLDFIDVTVSGNISAYTTGNQHPEISTSGINYSLDIARYYSLTNSGTEFSSYSPTFTFVAGDITESANTGNFVIKKYNSGWANVTNGIRTSTTIQATGVTTFSDFVAGEVQALDHFALSLATPQTNGEAFSNTNSLIAYDVSNNIFTLFDASTDHVTITDNSPLSGTISGLSGGNKLASATDFVSGIADLTALALKYTGTGGTGTFTATSATGKTGTSGSVTVYGPPAKPGVINGTAILCSGLTDQIFDISDVYDATTYTWEVPTGWTITEGQGTISIKVSTGMAGQDGDISVTAGNSYGTSSARTLTVAVSPDASIASVTGKTPLCISANDTYIAHDVILGGGTGAWSSNDDGLASVDASGLVTGVTSGSSSIVYTITGGCGGTVSAQQDIKINAIMPVSVSISADPGTTITSGANITFTASPTNEGSSPAYQWKINGENVGTNSATFSTTSFNNGDVVTCILTSSLGECTTDNPATSDTLTIVVNKSVTVNALLEGLFNGTNMNQALNETGAAQFTDGIADEMTVELYASDSPYELILSVPHVILTTDGVAIFSVSPAYSGSYYIAIKHRNSMETWSKNPVSFAGSVIIYNFITSASQTYGENVKEVASGVYAIYGGDENGDGIVDSGDAADIDNASFSFTFGYVIQDLNGDGIVDSSDMAILDNNSILFVMIQRPW